MSKLFCILFLLPLVIYAHPKDQDKLLQDSPSLAIEYIEQPFDVQKYFLDLTINTLKGYTLDTNTFVGRCAIYIKWKNKNPDNKFYFHLKGLHIDSVFYGTTKVLTDKKILTYTYPEDSPTFTDRDSVFSVQPPNGIETLDDSVVVYYHGFPLKDRIRNFSVQNDTLGGVFFKGGNYGDNVFANGQGYYSPNVGTTCFWMPCYDHPSDKAKFEGFFHVPKKNQVVSVGVLEDIYPNDPVFDTYQWKTDIECATSLLTFSVSDFSFYSYEYGDIPIDVYVPKYMQLPDRENLFKQIPGMLEAYENYFTPYPFEKVGFYVAAVGSVEHQTMVSIDADETGFNTYSAYLVAHELAHQWFGDEVTPLDYRDAWLNEAFASFSEAIWAGYKTDSSFYLKKMKEFLTSFLIDYPNYENHRLYDFNRIAPNGNNYPPNIYSKGAVVIGMLRYIMGDSLFFGGVREFLNKHKYGNFTTGQFKQDMEQYSKMDLSTFFDQWIYKSIKPTFEITASGVSAYGDGKDTTNNLYYINIHCTNNVDIIGLPMEFAAVTKDSQVIMKKIMFYGNDTTITFDEPVFNVISFWVNPGYNFVSLMQTLKKTVNYGKITDVAQEQTEHFQINQAGNYLLVQSSEIVNITLYDIWGNKILSNDIDNNSYLKRIDMGNLFSGTYFVKVSQSGKTYLKKICYIN